MRAAELAVGVRRRLELLAAPAVVVQVILSASMLPLFMGRRIPSRLDLVAPAALSQMGRLATLQA